PFLNHCNKNIVSGIVSKLINVVISVVNESKLGFVLNCTAKSVVLTATGIAAKRMNTFFNKSFTGKKLTNTTATSGEMTMRIIVTVLMYLYSNFCLLISASFMSKMSITVGMEPAPNMLIPSMMVWVNRSVNAAVST